jgi:hypothetical protein
MAGVTTIIRLNASEYDAGVFTAAGIEHVDLFFADCSLPPPDVVVRFLDIVDRQPGVIAGASPATQTHGFKRQLPEGGGGGGGGGGVL